MVAEFRPFKYDESLSDKAKGPGSVAPDRKPYVATVLEEQISGDFTNVAKNHSEYRKPQKIKD